MALLAETECINDKYSVKNLLFYRAIPNYVLPANADGHDLYACKDCGDRFLLESSYQYHIQRKSVLITYKCRHCGARITFFNRCNLLSHIKSHTFKTATINISDLKIDPLPLSFYKLNKDDADVSISSTVPTTQKANICFECKKDVTGIGPIYKDRANHYMEYTNKVYSCPICLLTLPTTCALIAHLRIHLLIPPFYCPECGVHLPNKTLKYPYNQGCACEGFNMMRATARFSCPIKDCMYYHPNDYKKHLKEKHFKKIYSCPSCVIACFNEEVMQKHLKIHDSDINAVIIYQCELCPGKIVMQGNAESHLNTHNSSHTVYPCWICNTCFKEVPDLLNHHVQNHDQNGELKKCLVKIENTKKIYRVVKQCDKCLRNVTYKCHYENINVLPNVCPYNCMSGTKSLLKKGKLNKTIKNKIVCPLCKEKVDESWMTIKKHFTQHHKEQRCGDITVPLQRVCIKKYLKQGKKVKEKHAANKKIKKLSRFENKTQNIYNVGSATENIKNNDKYICEKCQEVHETKNGLETHITTNHRDPSMAYQCMECGECFVVKPSFSIHLLFHGISNVDEYIATKKCYNENARNKCSNDATSHDVEEPLGENQCNICRESFDNTDNLEKHYRVHGMAFLMKNSLNKPGPS